MENQLKDSIVVYSLNSVVALAALVTVIYTIMIPNVDAGLVAVVSSISTLIGKTVLDIMMSQSGAEKEDPMTGVAKEIITLLKDQQNKEETMGLDVSKDRVSIHRNGMSVNTERND